MSRFLRLVVGCCCVVVQVHRADGADVAVQPKVDFSYAFGYPHRVTAGLPDSSDRTLVDCAPGSVTLSWSYGNLTNFPVASFMTNRTQYRIAIQAEVDGQKIAESKWGRVEGWMPSLLATFPHAAVQSSIEVIGGRHATIGRVRFTNTDTRSHQVALDCTVPGKWLGVSMAFVDPEQNARDRDSLMCGWLDRADRVMISVLGGDEYPLAANTLHPQLQLKPGETRDLWVIRPYRSYESMLPELRRRDWSREFEEGKAVWRELIGRATQLKLADAGVRNAYYAGLADFFIMREPVARDYLGIVPGTEQYRAANPTEGAIVSVALVQADLSLEAMEGYRMSLDQQGFDGNWADPEGWAWGCWFCSGLKSWYVMEHYRNTLDRDFLAGVFPRMMASSRWQERQRARSRVLVDGHRTINHGLMPRGMGDAGLKNDDSLYGVFLPDNIWAVFGDEMTWRAAEALGLVNEAAEARRIYETAQADLLIALHDGAIKEEGYRWIPGVANKTSGSRWGALNAAFPTRVLPANDELITGTLRKMETALSPGGIPMHTGWMEDGMWVAITLDNVAETHLLRGNGDAFAKYLYATLNHGTALYSWCEERGPEAGATKTTGDRQHLWTPVAVVRAIRDGLALEDGTTLHLGRGADRSWLTRGPLGGDRFSTHFGHVSYELQYDAVAAEVKGKVTLTASRRPGTLQVHVRLPEGHKVVSVSDPSARIINGGETLEWATPPADLSFTAKIQ
ncbi:MAG: hypothetical protein ABIZ04_20730 [Opitutus sp.]